MPPNDLSPPEARPEESSDIVAIVAVPVTAEDAARSKRRMVFAWIAAALALAATAQYFYRRNVDPLDALQAYDSGQRLMTIGRYNQAILAFDRATRLKPDFPDAYFLRGKAYVADFKTADAIREFSKVIELRPADPRALVERAGAYLELKDYQSSIRDTDRALVLDPTLARACNLRGVAVRSLGDPQNALNDFNRAVELAPSADNYYQRGATWQMLGEHRRAIEDFDRMIAIDPGGPAGYYARSESRLAIGDVAGAIEDHRHGKMIDGI
jgi:tetratricopeptide (TPR) repeat protein